MIESVKSEKLRGAATLENAPSARPLRRVRCLLYEIQNTKCSCRFNVYFKICTSSQQFNFLTREVKSTFKSENKKISNRCLEDSNRDKMLKKAKGKEPPAMLTCLTPECHKYILFATMCILGMLIGAGFTIFFPDIFDAVLKQVCNT